jgi:hypothetical protein
MNKRAAWFNELMEPYRVLGQTHKERINYLGSPFYSLTAWLAAPHLQIGLVPAFFLSTFIATIGGQSIMFYVYTQH